MERSRTVSSKEILYLDAASHQWLLPRCKMIIYHGGAGTTSAGLRAGIPNIVIPHAADQPFWGKRVHAIGAGTRPILVRKLSLENLTDAIAESEHDAIRKQACFIGQELGREDGIATSIAMTEKYSDEFLRM